MKSQLAGQAAEDRASSYLSEQGLKLVMQNYHCPPGEVDLIMRDRDYYVFVEVRSRTNTSFGGGAVSITLAKKKKVMRAALHYLIKNKLADKYPLRFDVVSIDGKSGVITWIPDAFGLDY